MSRAASFKRADVTRAITATQAAGLLVERVEVNRDGTIVVVPKAAQSAQSEPENKWDEVLPSDGTAAEIR